jgi:hypothetical protein
MLTGAFKIDVLEGLPPGKVEVCVGEKIYRAVWRKRRDLQHINYCSAYEIEVATILETYMFKEDDISEWKHLTWKPNEDEMWATLMRFVTHSQ